MQTPYDVLSLHCSLMDWQMRCTRAITAALSASAKLAPYLDKNLSGCQCRDAALKALLHAAALL